MFSQTIDRRTDRHLDLYRQTVVNSEARRECHSVQNTAYINKLINNLCIPHKKVKMFLTYLSNLRRSAAHIHNKVLFIVLYNLQLQDV